MIQVNTLNYYFYYSKSSGDDPIFCLIPATWSIMVKDLGVGFGETYPVPINFYVCDPSFSYLKMGISNKLGTDCWMWN